MATGDAKNPGCWYEAIKMRETKYADFSFLLHNHRLSVHMLRFFSYVAKPEKKPKSHKTEGLKRGENSVNVRKLMIVAFSDIDNSLQLR